jgi:hypothetical protein
MNGKTNLSSGSVVDMRTSPRRWNIKPTGANRELHSYQTNRMLKRGNTGPVLVEDFSDETGCTVRVVRQALTAQR